MSPEDALALTPDAIRQVDAQYRAFPPFGVWRLSRIREERWTREAERVAERRAGADESSFRKALELVKRAAAVDTGAIEGLYEVDRGFTFTVAGALGLWELELDKKGAEVRSLIEAQFGAYDLAVDAATGAQPITEALVRRFHEELCRAQKTYLVQTAIGPQKQSLPLGEYKHHPNHVRQKDGSIHAYCPVDLVPEEMHRLCEELKRPEFEQAHVVLQASYVHYAFVSIHPFADGNGRVARLLASVYLCRAHSIPFLVLADEKKAYLDALVTADAGEPQAFVDFVFERGVETFRLVADSLATAAAPSAEEASAAIRGLYGDDEGHTHEQVEHAGGVLLRMFSGELQRRLTLQLNESALSGDVGAPHAGPSGHVPADERHRAPLEAVSRFGYDVRTAYPAMARANGIFFVELPEDRGQQDDLLIRWGSAEPRREPRTELEVHVDELLPEPKKALHLRVSLAVERVLGQILADLSKLASEALRKHKT